MRFDHIALRTDDVDASVVFYQSRFPDVEILFQDETWAMIDCSGIKIAFVSPDEHPEHIAYSVSSRDELLAEAAKSGATTRLHRDGSESFYLIDPAGNAVEVVFYSK